MIKGIIFDLDGTLINTETCWKRGDYLLAEKHGYKLSEDFRYKLVGRGPVDCAQMIIEEYHIPTTVDELVSQRFESAYTFLFKELELMPFVQEVIDRLKQDGYFLAIATAGHDPAVLRRILETIGIHSYFLHAVSGVEVAHSKPAPDVYLEAARRMSLQPDECVVVEDAVNGIIGGKAAGMRVIGVNGDETIRQKLKEVGADYISADIQILLEKQTLT